MHVCCVVAGHLVVHGGRGPKGPLGDVHCLPLAREPVEWHAVAVAGPAVGLMAHAAVVIGTSDVLIVGGVAENESGDDLLLTLDFAANSATQRSVDGDAVILCGRRRLAHTLLRHGAVLYCVGGAELTADQPEDPLHEKICLYTATLPDS
eukprot:GGOE01050011.1.p2 GENE.GGOE01050011.1~~GGOE01050011.1.p2  ORF type:complete len:150 (+),score=36.87 GGOE01050011.1:608-1057(+)